MDSHEPDVEGNPGASNNPNVISVSIDINNIRPDNLSPATLGALHQNLRRFAGDFYPELSEQDRKDFYDVCSALLASCKGDPIFLGAAADAFLVALNERKQEEPELFSNTEMVGASEMHLKLIVPVLGDADREAEVEEVESGGAKEVEGAEEVVEEDDEEDSEEDNEEDNDEDNEEDNEEGDDEESDGRTKDLARPRESKRKPIVAKPRYEFSKHRQKKRKAQQIVNSDDDNTSEEEDYRDLPPPKRTKNTQPRDHTPPNTQNRPIPPAVPLGKEFGVPDYDAAYENLSQLLNKMQWDDKKRNGVTKLFFECLLSPAVDNISKNVVRFARTPNHQDVVAKEAAKEYYLNLERQEDVPEIIKSYWKWAWYKEELQEQCRWGTLPRQTAEYYAYKLFDEVSTLYKNGDEEVRKWVNRQPGQHRAGAIENALQFPWRREQVKGQQKNRAKMLWLFLNALGGAPALLLFNKHTSLKSILGSAVTIAVLKESLDELKPQLSRLHSLVEILNTHIWPNLIERRFGASNDEVNLSPLLKALSDGGWEAVVKGIHDQLRQQHGDPMRLDAGGPLRLDAGSAALLEAGNIRLLEAGDGDGMMDDVQYSSEAPGPEGEASGMMELVVDENMEEREVESEFDNMYGSNYEYDGGKSPPAQSQDLSLW